MLRRMWGHAWRNRGTFGYRSGCVFLLDRVCFCIACNGVTLFGVKLIFQQRGWIYLIMIWAIMHALIGKHAHQWKAVQRFLASNPKTDYEIFDTLAAGTVVWPNYGTRTKTKTTGRKLWGSFSKYPTRTACYQMVSCHFLMPSNSIERIIEWWADIFYCLLALSNVLLKRI